MDDYKRIKSLLTELRRELTAYISGSDDALDLTENFIKVRESDIATYELLMLIYNEFKTSNKLNKKRLIVILDKALDVKIETIDKLILDKITNDQNKTFMNKITSLITFRNAVKVTGLWMVIMSFLFIIYTIDETAFHEVSNYSLQLLDKTELIIKGQ